MPPELSTIAWSPVAADTSCDDGLACTRDDVCVAGACGGVSYTCDDGLACTADECDGDGGCSAPINAGACLIDGVCRAPGALATVGGCLACDPSRATAAWSPTHGAACDDGVACTRGDVCNGSSCGGEGYTCDDGIACTSDACDGDGGCTFEQVGGTCLIGQTCFADGASKPGDPCQACRPEVSATSTAREWLSWSPWFVNFRKLLRLHHRRHRLEIPTRIASSPR